jgi:hypothetical protein
VPSPSIAPRRPVAWAEHIELHRALFEPALADAIRLRKVTVMALPVGGMPMRSRPGWVLQV